MSSPLFERHRSWNTTTVAVVLSLATHGVVFLPPIARILQSMVFGHGIGSGVLPSAGATEVTFDDSTPEFPPDDPPEVAPLPEPPPPPPPPPPEPEELQLGVGDGDLRAKSWLGFADFLEHFAQPADTDQAALRVTPSGMDGRSTEPNDVPGADAPNSVPSPPSNPPTNPPSPPAPVAVAPPIATPNATDAAPTATKDVDPHAEPTEEPGRDPLSAPAPRPDQRSEATGPTLPDSKSAPAENAKPVAHDVLTKPVASPTDTPIPAPLDRPANDAGRQDPTIAPVERSATTEEGAAEKLPSATETTTEVERTDIGPRPRERTIAETIASFPFPVAPPPTAPLQAEPAQRTELTDVSETTPTPTAPPFPPAPASNASPPPAAQSSAAGPRNEQPTGEGELSESESDATSIISVPANLWKNGRPLAARGLTIKTRKPKFTVLTMVTASPRNPIVEIVFDREGEPKRMAFLRRSGVDDIDGPIMDAIAGWRASGPPLEKLRKDDTITVRMRLILVQ